MLIPSEILSRFGGQMKQETVFSFRSRSLEITIRLQLIPFPLSLHTGLGFGALKAVQIGANLRGGLLGCAAGGGAVACIMVGKKLKDYKALWDEVSNKRSQYRLVSTRLESLKEAVEKDLKAGVLLTGMPNLEKAIIVLLVFLAIYGSVLVPYILVK